MDDVRDEVGNLDSEVAGSQGEAKGVGSVMAESVVMEQPIKMGVQLNAAGAGSILSEWLGSC